MFFFGHYFVAKDHSKCIQSYQHGDERANRCGFVRASLALERILRMRKQVIHLERRVIQAMEQNESEKHESERFLWLWRWLETARQNEQCDKWLKGHTELAANHPSMHLVQRTPSHAHSVNPV